MKNNKGLVKKISIKAGNIYAENIRKKELCPKCRAGNIAFNKKAQKWKCGICNYELTKQQYEAHQLNWYCSNCGAFLNSQEGFNLNSEIHKCNNCGHDNCINSSTAKHICLKCGKLLDNLQGGLCAECKKERTRKIAKGVLYVAGAVVVLGAGLLAINHTSSKSDGSENNKEDDNTDNSNDSDTASNLNPPKNDSPVIYYDDDIEAIIEEHQRWAWEDEVVELCTHFEEMSEEEYEERYNDLPIEYQMQVDDSMSDYADDAIGDSSWRYGTDWEDE